MKQNIYKWHRILGVITLIPVIFWTLSGIMHPFMAHFFKPTIAKERIEKKGIDTTQIKFSLQEVLEKNNISSFKNFRIIDFEGTTYYQVKTIDDKLNYYDASSANLLTEGDKKYAIYLSRYFLQDQKSKIKDIALVTHFTTQYKFINRYLPVYKVTFDRSDAMQVYVETSSSKLATYNPKSRQVFLWIFDTFHNWSFLNAISNNYLRIILMTLFLSIIVFSTASGLIIYGFMWKNFKKSKPTEKIDFLKRHHRKIGFLVSLVTLTFSFSGAFHAVKKWNAVPMEEMVYEPIINVKDIKVNSIAFLDKNSINVSVIKFYNSVYYQCDYLEGKDVNKKFINAFNGNIDNNVALNYSLFLVEFFNEKLKINDPTATLKTKSTLENFDRKEYGFVNKRLPVVKMEYNSKGNRNYYLELSTSRLAALVSNEDRVEGYSFAILHKFSLLEWAGKNIRDLFTVISALGVFVVSIAGLLLFLKKK